MCGWTVWRVCSGARLGWLLPCWVLFLGIWGRGAGVGDGKFPALVAASAGEPLAATVVPADAAAFLAPFPVGLLPVCSGVKAGMRRFGLGTLGEVASMRAGFLVEQFGQEGRRAWDLCRGVDEDPLVPSAFEEPIVESASLPFASASLGLLLGSLSVMILT